jgi:hypothetical protein
MLKRVHVFRPRHLSPVRDDLDPADLVDPVGFTGSQGLVRRTSHRRMADHRGDVQFAVVRHCGDDERAEGCTRNFGSLPAFRPDFATRRSRICWQDMDPENLQAAQRYGGSMAHRTAPRGFGAESGVCICQPQAVGEARLKGGFWFSDSEGKAGPGIPLALIGTCD